MSDEFNKENPQDSYEDINSFLDSLSEDSYNSDSASDFFNQMYSKSYDSITSDFDALLKQFQNIDPDDPMAEQPKVVAPVKPAPEMEDVYSYSTPAAEPEPKPEAPAPRPVKRFTDAVQQAMDAEISDSAAQGDADADSFRLSLDKLEGEDLGFGEAMQRATAPKKKPIVAEQSTRVYSADAVRQAAGQPRKAPAQRPAGQKPQQNAGEKGEKSKKKGRTFLPQRNDSVLEIFRKVVFMVSIVVVTVCVVIIGNTYLLQPYLQKGRQNHMQELMNQGFDSENSFKAQYSNTDLPEGARLNLAQYYAANQDFYGYLEIPGTSISTPVVQGSDNSYYLKHNFFRESTKYGCPFVNYKNTYAALDYNTSIFGHNMEYDSLVFGDLEKYRDIEFFKKAPIIHLETMYADYNFKIYAVYLTDTSVDQGDGWYLNYIFTQLKDENECLEYIGQMDQRKLYSTGVDITPSDKLLTLSTCAYDFTNERLVVVGRLVRDGESTQVDTSKAMKNKNPRYPDKYYAKKGLSNPYAKGDRWIPNA